MAKRRILFIIVVLGLGGVLYSLVSIGKPIYNYHESAKRYEGIQTIYKTDKQKHRKLLQINNEYVGWISLKGTNIHYPVAQAQDNNFYLTHNFSREKDFVGSIFMDYRNSKNTVEKNIILYGHNMKDGSMFGSLKKFKEQGYYQTHKMATYEIQGSTYQWEIFSVYTSEDTQWMKTQFANENEFTTYITDRKKNSFFTTNTEVNSQDHILTLSTCTTGEETERMILHAKLIKKGKDLSTNEF
jgi:sortase B